jgi:hypothetical protein
MNDSEQKWQKLVEAARKAHLPPLETKAPPPDFATRIVAMRDRIIALARLLFWRRWSLYVAMLCFGVLVMIFLLYHCTESPTPLIETPDLLQPPAP